MTYTPIPAGQDNWDVPVNAAFVDQDNRITTNAGAIATTNGTIDPLEVAFNPVDHGLIAWNYDPQFAAAGSGALTSGTLYMTKVKVTAAATSNSVRYMVNAAAITPVVGQNFMALFDNAGNRVAISGDIGATDFASIGLKNTAWVTPASVSPGYYYVALLTNAATGVNPWKTTTTVAAGLSVNLGTADVRNSSGGTGLTGLTAVPSTVTMANRSVGSANFWSAL